MLTTIQAAERLNTSRRIVQRLIAQGRLKATKYGRDWLIDERDLEAVKERRQGWQKGKPRKTPVTSSAQGETAT